MFYSRTEGCYSFTNCFTCLIVGEYDESGCTSRTWAVARGVGMAGWNGMMEFFGNP